MKKIFLCLVLAIGFAFAKSAPKTHDGFFLSGIAGFGYGNFTNEFSANGVKMESKGLQLETGFKIGAAIIPNLILHGTIDANAVLTDIDFSNKDGDKSTLDIGSQSFRVLIYGVGITYYIPGGLNMFVSASLGLAEFTDLCVFGKIISDYDSDLSFNITAGKEWWVNNELGVGVALSFNHSSAKSKLFDYEGKASFNSLSVVATVTFN